MLGLAMHEPHTCLLREEVVFDPAKKRVIAQLAKLEHGKLLEEEEKMNESSDSEDGDDKNQPPLSAAVQSYSEYEQVRVSISFIFNLYPLGSTTLNHYFAFPNHSP